MKKKMDVLFLILSIIIGGFLGLALEYIYDIKFPGIETRVPVIVLYLFVFLFVFGFILLFKGLVDSAFVKFGKVIAFTLLSAIVFVGCSALFEYLYELDIKVDKNDTIQYAFLIDDSGSMTNNDESNVRYNAVETIIRQLPKTSNFAVYSYSKDSYCSTPMGTENSDSFSYVNKTPASADKGRTNTVSAIMRVIDDVSSSGASHTKVIVLTDGGADDENKYYSLLRKCSSNNVSVSSLGFGQPNVEFLNKMASDTGGTYAISDDISTLASNLDTIVKADVEISKDRDLLGRRNDYTSDSVLHAILRVVFLILLGLIWSLFKMLLVGETKFMKLSAVLSVVFCSLAAIICELGFLLFIPGYLLRILFCMLWACTLIPKKVYTSNIIDGQLNSVHDGKNNRSLADDFEENNRGVGGPKSFL